MTEQSRSNWPGIILASSATGLFISLYVLGISWIDMHSADADPLERTAIEAAAALDKQQIFDEDFGYLGLRSKKKQRGLSTVIATNQIASLLFARHHLPAIEHQARLDREALTRHRHTMALRLQGLVSMDGQVYQMVRNRLRRTVRGQERLKSLQLTLGKRTPRAMDKKFVDDEDFIAIAPGSDQLPDVLKIDAIFSGTTSNGKAVPSLPRRTIITIADKDESQDVRSGSSCFTVQFPQGRPDKIDSLASLFALTQDVDSARHSPGRWLQTAGGAVPGSGSLSPPTDASLARLGLGESCALAFYHWLRNLEDCPDPVLLESLYTHVWSPPIPNPEAVDQDNSNSCLVMSSDVRDYAFLRQSGPGEGGQKALRAAFSGKPVDFPDTALSAIVSREGQPYLGGRNDFDSNLIKDFFEKLYLTNLAARDTASLATLSRSFAEHSLNQLNDRSFLIETELASLKRSPRSRKIDEAVEMHINQLQMIKQNEIRLRKLITTTQKLKDDAERVAAQSFEISSKLFALTAHGLHRMDGPETRFLLGKRFIFAPIVKALTESQLLDHIDGADSNNVWLTPQSGPRVFGPIAEMDSRPNTRIMVENMPLAELEAQQNPIAPSPAQTVICDARAIYKSGLGKSYVLSSNPFSAYKNAGQSRIASLARDQLAYYNQSAIKTGTPAVSWSMLIKDNVHVKDESLKIGMPIPSDDIGWCKRLGPYYQSNLDLDCPGVAAEVQVRCPLIFKADEPLQELTLTDPRTGQRLPQIPPCGLELF